MEEGRVRKSFCDEINVILYIYLQELRRNAPFYQHNTTIISLSLAIYVVKLFVRFYLFILRERGREGEREEEKHQCVLASHAPPTWNLTYNPGMCPDWESNRKPFGLQAGTQSMESHQPGLCYKTLRVKSFKRHSGFRKILWKQKEQWFLSYKQAPILTSWHAEIQTPFRPVCEERIVPKPINYSSPVLQSEHCQVMICNY